jgi:hypothetical protein
VEFMMSNEPLMPNVSVDRRLLGNLRRARLELEELGLQLDEVLARFDQADRQHKRQRIQQSLGLLKE